MKEAKCAKCAKGAKGAMAAQVAARALGCAGWAARRAGRRAAGWAQAMRARAAELPGRVARGLQAAQARVGAKLACERGQGTTEYAILVGVLVVIAILAITVFRPKLEELWNAIASGINGL